MKFLKKEKGFTLIELLVVVSIIGVLASVVLGSLSSARARARETAFVAGVYQLQKSFELYYLENGEYPDSTISGTSGLVNIRNKDEYNYNTFTAQLDGYITELPTLEKNIFWRYDSRYSNNSYTTCRPDTNNNQDYAILFETESKSYGDSFIGMDGSRFRHCLRNPR